MLKASIEVAAPVPKPLKLQYAKYYFATWQSHWMFLVPAFIMGVLLYTLKRYHIGTPTVYFPLLTLLPTAAFYAIIFGSGSTLDDARQAGWLFPAAEQNSFWSQLEGAYGGLAAGRVEWSALPAAIPSWLVGLLIVNLDNMLKLASTEASLAIDFDYSHEMVTIPTRSTAPCCAWPCLASPCLALALPYLDFDLTCFASSLISMGRS